MVQHAIEWESVQIALNTGDEEKVSTVIGQQGRTSVEFETTLIALVRLNIEQLESTTKMVEKLSQVKGSKIGPCYRCNRKGHYAKDCSPRKKARSHDRKGRYDDNNHSRQGYGTRKQSHSKQEYKC